MKPFFKIALILKVLFIINVIAIKLYREYGIQKNKNLSLLLEKFSLNLDIHLPTYITVLAVFLPIAFFICLTANFLYSFKPCSRLAKFFHERKIGAILFIIEVILLTTLIFLAYSKIKDAFATRDYGILGTYLQRFIDQEESARLRFLKKFSALNLLIPILATLLIITNFWRLRRSNIIKCQ